MRRVEDVLVEHQLVAWGMGSTRPDTCSCGDKIDPGDGSAEQRNRSFARHQALFIVGDPLSPPWPWEVFGTHAGDDPVPPLTFWGADEGGDPIWERVLHAAPGQLRWKFDGGRGAMLDQNDQIVGYWTPPTREEVRAVLEQNLRETTGECTCDEAYTGRDLVDPSCGWHTAYGTADSIAVDDVMRLFLRGGQR